MSPVPTPAALAHACAECTCTASVGAARRCMSACTPHPSPDKTSCTHARRQCSHTAASAPSANNSQAGETRPVVLVKCQPQAAVATALAAAAGLQQLLHVVHAEPVAAAAAVLGKRQRCLAALVPRDLQAV